MVNTYIKSPLNYVGGKYKLLPQLIPLLKAQPSIVDLFGGGMNVSINMPLNGILYNDICTPVVDLMENLYKHEFDYIHTQIIKTIDFYGLSRSDVCGYKTYGCDSNHGLAKYNKYQYCKLREDYNKNPDWIKLYTLIVYSFNNQIRFNSKGEFNMPCGKRDYNFSIQSKLKAFVGALHNANIWFNNYDFRYWTREMLSLSDFVYVDPPYYNATATYNKNGSWTAKDERDLLVLLESYNKTNIHWARSANLKYDNPLLKDWMGSYYVHFLNDVEVLITNYKPFSWRLKESNIKRTNYSMDY